jgi:hypothetical protein
MSKLLDSENVKVYIRVRPLSNREAVGGNKNAVSVSNSSIILQGKSEPKVYSFDFVANENISQVFSSFKFTETL